MFLGCGVCGKSGYDDAGYLGEVGGCAGFKGADEGVYATGGDLV